MPHPPYSFVNHCEPFSLTGDGRVVAVNSCLLPVAALVGCEVLTSEGLGNSRSGFHPVQGEEGAGQQAVNSTPSRCKRETAGCGVTTPQQDVPRSQHMIQGLSTLTRPACVLPFCYYCCCHHCCCRAPGCLPWHPVWLLFPRHCGVNTCSTHGSSRQGASRTQQQQQQQQ
jgi:hypothetical protein